MLRVSLVSTECTGDAAGANAAAAAGDDAGTAGAAAAGKSPSRASVRGDRNGDSAGAGVGGPDAAAEEGLERSSLALWSVPEFEARLEQLRDLYAEISDREEPWTQGKDPDPWEDQPERGPFAFGGAVSVRSTKTQGSASFRGMDSLRSEMPPALPSEGAGKAMGAGGGLVEELKKAREACREELSSLRGELVKKTRLIESLQADPEAEAEAGAEADGGFAGRARARSRRAVKGDRPVSPRGAFGPVALQPFSEALSVQSRPEDSKPVLPQQQPAGGWILHSPDRPQQHLRAW